ncbi:MAG TPA: glycosyltransferase [Gemmatimonadales bacterium]|nr:glycosyltransferase [Gemmatimonadales bacterium]
MASRDIRWFAPNKYCTLVVPRLRARGFSIALEGDQAAGLAIAMDAQVAAAAYTYAARVGCPLIHYVWDLPPWRLGRGRHDWVWHVFGRYLRLPRVGRRYVDRPGYYSRLRFVAHRAREVWVPSAHTAASVQERLGVAGRRVPFCFDSDRFTPPPSSAPAPRTRGLLSVSRLTPQKNHAAVIRAAARFAPPLEVRIVGSGPERDGLARLARELGVPCAIESTLSEAEMVTAYRSAAVVVCPSRFEGFGLTPMEAIASGAPVVVSDIPPHREFLGDSPRYFLLDDEDGLAAAIAAAREDGRPPSRDVLEPLSIEAAADRFAAGLAPYVR